MSLFVDIVTIQCKAGDGGNGCVSFHREKFVQAGGPDGGDGGRGGDVAFVASERMHTLMDFRMSRKFFAENGADGTGRFRSGKSGAPLLIAVPVGTVIRDKASERVLFDMRSPGEERVLLRGGNGGHGNAKFATPTRRAPNFAKPGIKPPIAELTLELKSIADVGLVGMPNVGKSSILSAVTSARPKIANYHFTTLSPNLGIVRRDEDSFVLADIPGLVEGAHEGAGLGHEFLRHIERTRLLIHVLDISGSEERDPLDDYDLITRELTRYGDLIKRTTLIAANKTDLPGAEENLERLRERLPDAAIHPVSAATRKGLTELMRAAAGALRDIPLPEPFYEENFPDAESVSPFGVSVEDGVYVVYGPAAERLIASVNFEDQDSLNWFQRALRRAGVIDALREAGAKEGDAVVMADMEFDFME